MDRNLFLKLKAALSEVAEEEGKNSFKNRGTIFSNSGFRMNTKSALSYLDNLYKLKSIFKNSGNKEALQDVEKEIQSIDTQLKNKTSPVKDQYVYFLDGTKVSYDPTLLPALEKGVRLATNEETKEKIRGEINYIKKQIRDKQFVDLGTPNRISLTAKSLNKDSLDSPTKSITKKTFALEPLNEDLEEDIKSDGASQITDIKSVFANSKVRDSKGNLLECYHSSNNDFDNFELKDNVNGRLYGSGIYFSTNSDYMFSYGKIGYECYLNIINPWYHNSSYEEIKSFIEKDTEKPIDEIKLKEYYAKGYGSDTTILDYYENVIKEEGITFKDLLIRNNYDGIIVCDDREELEDRYNEIIAFDPNQVYIIKKYYKEKKNLGLEEDIEKHDTLNPLLFDENDELRDDVKEAIIKIVNQFIEDLSADGVKFSLKDIILVGSNVSYNYTKDSDLDIHIVADSESLDCNPEVYTLLYGAYRSLFNKNYDITIKGIPVEIYVELE